LAEAKRRQAAGIPFSGLIYGHQLQVTIGDCVRDLEIIANVAEPADLVGQVLYLPL
jgi:hypothetical protein